jgi:hypothetical protein
MAKTARKNRARNARRANRALAACMRGDAAPAKTGNPIVVAMMARYANQSTSHGDARREARKKACRGKVLRHD